MRAGPDYNGAVPAFSAEDEYLFRHPLLRAAAYDLHLPGERARLHRLALQVLEDHLGGVPPAPSTAKPELDPHPSNEHSAELALHARLAAATGEPSLRARELRYLTRAAIGCESRYRYAEAAAHLEAISRHPDLPAASRLPALLRAAQRWDDAGAADRALAALFAAEAMPDESRAWQDRAARARLAGAVYLHCGELGAAEANDRYALRLAREYGDGAGELRSLGDLANTLQEQRRFEEAEALFREALAIAGERDDRRQRAVLLSNLAVLLGRTRGFRERQALHEEALRLHREIGNRRFEAVALGNLGQILWAGGDFAGALQCHTAALALHREIGHRRFEGVELANLGRVLQDLGRLAEAEDAYLQSLAIAREGGNRIVEGCTLASLADLRRRTEGPAAAGPLFDLALGILRALGQDFALGDALTDYGLCLLAAGRVEDARTAWQEGAGLMRASGDADSFERTVRIMRAECAAQGAEPLDRPTAPSRTAPSPSRAGRGPG